MQNQSRDLLDADLCHVPLGEKRRSWIASTHDKQAFTKVSFDEQLGSLNNQPVSTDELQFGALVSFGPEHIIQIYDDE